MRKICGKSGTIDFLARIVDEREALELPAVLESLLQLAVAHPVPNVLDVLQNTIVIYSVLISIMIKLYGTNEKKR